MKVMSKCVEAEAKVAFASGSISELKGNEAEVSVYIKREYRLSL